MLPVHSNNVNLRIHASWLTQEISFLNHKIIHFVFRDLYAVSDKSVLYQITKR